MYFAKTVDVAGILYVVSLTVEFIAEHPCVNVWFVPAVFVNQSSTTLPG